MRPLILPSLLTLSLVAQDATVVARLHKDVTTLASPTMKGRGNGEPGLEAAARYLERRLQEAGVKPMVRRFPMPMAPKVEKVLASAISGDAPMELVRGRDFEIMGWSGSGDFPAAPLVLMGSGLSLPAFNETTHLSLRGKVLVIPRSVPEVSAPGTSPLERSLSQRLKRLESLQPAAVLVLEEDAPARFQREEGPASFAMPVLSVRKGFMDTLRPGLEAERLQAAQGGKPWAKDLVVAPWVAMALELELEPRTAQLPNLIAEIHGTGGLFASERMVIGAHMDHLGLGSRHSLGGEAARGVAHLGADDNASGSALVVELARRFKQKPLRRTLVVALFGGEEEGLLGSRAYLDRPDTPVKSMRFMANFDMVGRLDAAKPQLFLGGYGAPAAAVSRAKALAPQGWIVSGDLGASVGGSDHMSFASSNIPTFFFFTGLHSDYHRPSDTADKINAKGMAVLADYAEALLRDLDAQAELPAFDPSTAKSVSASTPLKVSLGTIPDYATDPRGFRINGVAKGGAAEAAGLRSGDVITRIAGKDVKDIHGYMAVLSELKAGVPVLVEWLRDNQPMSAEATPKGRN